MSERGVVDDGPQVEYVDGRITPVAIGIVGADHGLHAHDIVDAFIKVAAPVPPRFVIKAVDGILETVLAGDDDAGFVEEPDLHDIVGLVEGHAEDIEAADEIGDGGGGLYSDFLHDIICGTL